MQRGEIRVGGLRMCLFEIVGGFYSIRSSLEKTLGPAAGTLLYRAGIEGGRRFVSSAAKIGMIKTRKDGLADCIDIFSQAGFGNFHLMEADWSIPRIIIECAQPSAFEAYAFHENETAAKTPICDYARGVFSGFYQELETREDIMCLEIECKAIGSPRCIFEIGPHDEMMSKAVGVRAKV